LNKWNEYLGTAKYVIFGAMNVRPQFIVRKHYECLASGAVPIMPESHDFDFLGIEPMVHYIPLRRVIENNDYLAHLLKHYNLFKQIGMNAAEWHVQRADGLIFGGFEDVVREITKERYPRRSGCPRFS